MTGRGIILCTREEDASEEILEVEHVVQSGVFRIP